MASPHIVIGTDQNFENEVLTRQEPVLVFCSATWSGPCRTQAPIVDKFADEFAGKVRVVSVDIDASPETASNTGVRSVPYFIVYKGGETTSARACVATRDDLVRLLSL